MPSNESPPSESGPLLSATFRVLHEGFAVVLGIYVFGRDFLASALPGLVLFGVGAPVLCAYHVVAHRRGDSVATSLAAAGLFGAGSIGWFTFRWIGFEFVAYAVGTLLLIGSLFVVCHELWPYARRTL